MASGPMAWILIDRIVRGKMLSLVSSGWELEPWVWIEREHRVRREEGLELSCTISSPRGWLEEGEIANDIKKQLERKEVAWGATWDGIIESQRRVTPKGRTGQRC